MQTSQATGIIQQGDNKYFLQARGHAMTLAFDPTYNAWVMKTVNATVKAYSRGIPSNKYFDDLEAVEKKYKSWVGITELHGSNATDQASSVTLN